MIEIATDRRTRDAFRAAHDARGAAFAAFIRGLLHPTAH